MQDKTHVVVLAEYYETAGKPECILLPVPAGMRHFDFSEQVWSVLRRFESDPNKGKNCLERYDNLMKVLKPFGPTVLSVDLFNLL